MRSLQLHASDKPPSSRSGRPLVTIPPSLTAGIDEAGIQDASEWLDAYVARALGIFDRVSADCEQLALLEKRLTHVRAELPCYGFIDKSNIDESKIEIVRGIPASIDRKARR